MPKLTPEQKEHLKMAHRANMRIEETWSLFCMYLSQDKKPIDALELARQAVCVWADWMDENEVDPPDIPRPDFGQQIVDGMGKMFEKFPGFTTPAGIGFDPPSLNVDAEFGPDPDADERTSHPKGNDSPNSNTNPLGLTGEAKHLFDAMTASIPPKTD